MTDRIRLDGRVAVVTGAAGVIGTATMRLLAERGARLVAVDRREQDLAEAIKDLPASAQVLAVAADVTDEDEVAGYVGAAIDKFGTIDAFLLWRLTGGKVHATDATNASRTLLYDIHRGAFDDDLLRLVKYGRRP